MDYFIKYAFLTCRKEGSYIWGVYPVNNPYFFAKKKKEYTTYLSYIIGCFYGYFNRPKLNNIKLSISNKYNGNKEDVERSILYYVEDGKVVRFNKVSFETKYYNNTGGIGTFDERLKPMREASLELQKKYGKYGKVVTRPNGMTEFKLNKGGMINEDEDPLFQNPLPIVANPPPPPPPPPLPQIEQPLPKDTEKGGKLNNDELDRDNPDNTQVFVDKIKETPKIKKLQKKIEELINDASIPPVSSGLYHSGSKKRGEIIGTKGYTFNLGGGRRRFLPVGEFVQNKKNPELFKAIVEYANEILPTGFEYSVITVNKNLKAKKHKDGGNDGLGCITFLGDYTGGGLYIYDENDKPTLFNTHNVVIGFNGAKLAHRTEAFKGNRYAMIFYQQKNKFKIPGLKMVGSGVDEIENSDFKVY